MSHEQAADTSLSLSAQIETLLFYFAKEISIKELAKMLNVSTRDIKKSVKEMTTEYSGRGLRVVTNGRAVSLVTPPEMSAVLESLTEQEKQKALSKSALETLSIVCYKAPVGRADIDYIRGVNSTYALRNLLTRGLIEKVKDGSAVHYQPTTDALKFLGLEQQSDLPDFESILKKADEIISHES